MKIRMSEIPAEGREFNFNNETAELNKVLSDITRDEYQIDVSLVKRDAFYELKGEITAKIPDLCSRCGEDIKFPVTTQFNDVLIEKLSDQRGSRYSKGTNSHGGEAEVAYYEGDVFDLGEYVREVLALDLPEYPECQVQGCPNADKVKDYVKELNEESEKFDQKEEGHPGFNALKNLKLN